MKLCPPDGLQKGRCIALGGALCVNQKHALDNRAHTKRHDKGRYLKPMDSHSVDKSYHHAHDNDCKKRSGQILISAHHDLRRNHVGKGDGIGDG